MRQFRQAREPEIFVGARLYYGSYGDMRARLLVSVTVTAEIDAKNVLVTLKQTYAGTLTMDPLLAETRLSVKKADLWVRVDS